MAPIAKSLAIAATAFTALGAAAPGHNHGHNHNHKRDEVIVWKTVTTVVWTTVDVTTTVYPGDEAPPSTIIEETVNHATAPALPEVKPETTTTAAEPTSTVEPEAPSVDNPEAQVVQPTIPTEVPIPTQVIPDPVETSTQEPEPVETSDPAPPTSGGPCSASSPCVGQVTFYDVATSMSAPSSCGDVNDGSTDDVIALPVGIMKDSDCGRTVVIKYGGKTSRGTVVDKCMGCDNTSIDLSRHFFSLLAPFEKGRLHGVEWYLE
ncbi:uncharacterized protein BJX67DRAFT_67163 [Aspergillus lucknowensis]|uniref:Allergen Asp f 7 n=1 Tax=Aspergillus lucknowensis TaxID=176173 RepID=A0ABR4LWY6_9EURO